MCLVIIQALLLAALATVGAAAWFAVENANFAATELALVSRGQRLHLQADTMHDALRADVNAALLADAADPDAAEVVLASVRENARLLAAALEALGRLALPQDLNTSVGGTKAQAEAYIARATAITAIALRNRDRALTMRPKFAEAFDQLRLGNNATTELFARHMQGAESQAARAATTSARWILATVGAAAALTCLLVALVGSSMRRSLRQVRDAARALANGNLTVRSELRGRDEVGELSEAVNRMANELQSMIDKLRAEADRDAFGTQLVEALEMSDTEDEVHRVTARAMSQIALDRPMELLLSDSSRAHLERATQHPEAGAPQCTVESPFSCVAVRRGNPVVFADSEALNACPRLRGRACGPVSAVCVPVSFMGRSLGVLHASGPVNQPPQPDQIAQLTTLGIQAGARIGTVRAFERTQLQARTDSLTGLNNRRTLEQTARGLVANGTVYTFVLADLDHFKRLNDSHGHEAGDKALRLFSDVLKKCVRGGDCVGRWGGEEFALVLARAGAEQSAEVIQRLRADLAQALLVSNCPPFTASFGLADSSMSSVFEDVVRIADDALYSAKREGRDRATIGSAQRSRDAERARSEHSAGIDVQMLAQQA